jgi:hypothetical protein
VALERRDLIIPPRFWRGSEGGTRETHLAQQPAAENIGVAAGGMTYWRMDLKHAPYHAARKNPKAGGESWDRHKK